MAGVSAPGSLPAAGRHLASGIQYPASFCIQVHLEDPEDIIIGVKKISLPAAAGDCELFKGDLSA